MSVRKRSMWVAAAVIGSLTTAGTIGAQEPESYDAAWEQLRQLAGTWDSHIVGREGSEALIRYHVTSGGSVVWEEFVGDTPEGVRDMATAYHRDGDGLVATHYCGAENQPRMRAVTWDPEDRVVRFDFWDVTNLEAPDAYHTTNIELYFEDDDNVELRFRGTQDGVVEDDWQVHRLRRISRRTGDPGGAGSVERDFEREIAGAVEALPVDLRAGAEVRVWDGEWSLLTVREGDNGMVCLADRPDDDRFQSACYHRSLEDFMAVGRRLRGEGLSGAEYQEARWAEVEAGRLSMPATPAMVYNYFHDDPAFDPRHHDPTAGSRLHAIYLQGMTAEGTGLSTEAGSGPWLMWPGKPSAHVMISLPG